MARSYWSPESAFVPGTTDHHSLRAKSHFDVADQRRRIRFAIDHQPGFIGALEHQFSRTIGRERVEHRHESDHRRAAVLSVGPINTRGETADERSSTLMKTVRTEANEENDEHKNVPSNNRTFY